MIFLVDAKLVLLQSSSKTEGSLKYDMRVIANNVEYFDLMRDQMAGLESPPQSLPESPSSEHSSTCFDDDRGLSDSLWFFDGNQMQCWPNVEDLLQPASADTRDLPATVSIPTDFYPTSIILKKGIILGVETELIQRRDIPYAFFRFGIRVCFIPSSIPRSVANIFQDTTISSPDFPPIFIVIRYIYGLLPLSTL